MKLYMQYGVFCDCDIENSKKCFKYRLGIIKWNNFSIMGTHLVWIKLRCIIYLSVGCVSYSRRAYLLSTGLDNIMSAHETKKER